MPFTKANTYKEAWDQVQDVKKKAKDIITALALPESDARSQGMIHVRGMCNTLAAMPVMLRYKAAVRLRAARTIRSSGPPGLHSARESSSVRALPEPTRFAYEYECSRTACSQIGRRFLPLARTWQFPDSHLACRPLSNITVLCYRIGLQSIEKCIIQSYCPNKSSSIHTHPAHLVNVVLQLHPLFRSQP